MLLWFCKICFLCESIQRKLTPLVKTWWPYDLWAGLSVNRSAFLTWSGHVFCSCAKHFSVTMPLSTQEYKWVAKISQGSLKNVVGGWGPWDGLASHQGGSSKTPSCFMWGHQVYKLRALWFCVCVSLPFSAERENTFILLLDNMLNWYLSSFATIFFSGQENQKQQLLGEAYSYSCNGYSKKSN